MDPETLSSLFGGAGMASGFGMPQMPSYYPSAGEAFAGPSFASGGFSNAPGLPPGYAAGAIPSAQAFPVPGAPPVEPTPTTAGGADGSGSKGAQIAGKANAALQGMKAPAAPDVVKPTTPRQAEFHALRPGGIAELLALLGQGPPAQRQTLGRAVG